MSKWNGPVRRELWMGFTVGWTIFIGAIYLFNLFLWESNSIATLSATLSAFAIMAFISLMIYINSRPVWDYVYSSHKREGVLEAVEAALGNAELEFSRHILRRGWSMAVLVAAWMLWLPIWYFRWGADLEDARRFAVVMLSILLLLMVLLVIWVPWSMRHGSREERRMWEDPAFRSRFWASTVGCLGSMAVVTCWLWAYADGILLGSVMLMVILLVYVGLVVGPAQRLYGRAEKEE